MAHQPPSRKALSLAIAAALATGASNAFAEASLQMAAATDPQMASLLSSQYDLCIDNYRPNACGPLISADGNTLIGHGWSGFWVAQPITWNATQGAQAIDPSLDGWVIISMDGTGNKK